MLAHTEVEGFQTEVEEESVLRCRNRTEVTHQLSNELGHVSHLAKRLGISQTVIALIWRGQTWELVSVGIPIEVAAIDHTSTYLGCMPIHILGRGMCHDVATPLKRTTVDRGGESVIDDERHPMLVCHLGKTFDVEHIGTRVADGFAKEALGVGTKLLFDALIIPIRVNEGTLDAELLHRHTKEVIRATIDAVGRDEMVASLTDVENGIEVSRLSAGSQHSTYTAFEGCNLLGHHIVRGVGQTGVEIATIFQVEETSHLLAGVVLERGALIDGELLWLALRWFPSAMNADGLKVFLVHIAIFI